MTKRWAVAGLVLAAVSMALVLAFGASAASHREAPLIALDPTADITDFFMFRSYEPGHADKVVMVMDVIPGEEPGFGPNYFNFDPSVRYRIGIDNDGDGIPNNVELEFRFKQEIRGVVDAAGLPLSYVAVPPITALDGAGSEGLGLRQKYSVTMTTNGPGRPSPGPQQKLGDDLIAVPSNVGPRTMPDYPALAAQGVYDLGNGVRVFAGQREDPFYIDVGAIFDTLNFRRAPAPLLTPEEDANDGANPFGTDMLSGYNVHTIAIEMPASMLTSDGQSAEGTAFPAIGAFASTARPEFTSRGKATGLGVTQVQRLANPLVNEVIIGTKDKDEWNAGRPENEGKDKFIDYYVNPRLSFALQLVFGVPSPQTGRSDLADLLLKYKPTDNRFSELLRLNLAVPPTALADQKRLGPLAHDAAGNATPDPASWPNGRRPKDDVTDIATRVVGGMNYIAGMAGDGVNTDDATLPESFPFLATPFDGRNRVHQNPTP